MHPVNMHPAARKRAFSHHGHRPTRRRRGPTPTPETAARLYGFARRAHAHRRVRSIREGHSARRQSHSLAGASGPPARAAPPGGAQRCGTGVRGGRRNRSQIRNEASQRVPISLFGAFLSRRFTDLGSLPLHPQAPALASIHRRIGARVRVHVLAVLYDVMLLIQVQTLLMSREAIYGAESRRVGCRWDDRIIYRGDLEG